MRPYVTDVNFNLQGGGTYKLGPKTLIIGPNMAGKSSIVRAVELATTGRASDVAGRDTLALDADLWTLAGDGIEVASASVLFSDGEPPAAWTLQHSKKAKRVGRTAVFPLRDVRSAILGSAETARKFFLRVAGEITWETVVAEFPEVMRPKLAPYKMADGAAGLLAAIEGTKKRVRDLNAQAKAQRETSKSMSVGLAAPPSSAEVAKARIAADMIARVEQTAKARDRIGVVNREIETVATRLAAATAAVAEADRAWAALPPPLPDIVAHAMAVGEYLVKHDADHCAICGFKVMPGIIGPRVEKARARVAEAMKVEERRRTLGMERANARAEEAVAAADLRRLNAERESLSKIIGESNGPDAPAGDYAALVATAAKWESVRAAEGRAVDLEAEATTLAKLTELAATVMARLLERARVDFETRVRKFLPPTMRFGVELRDGEREVMRVGLYRWPDVSEPGILSTALSGAEWATMTAALSAAIVSSYPADAPIIIVPEDRDFDRTTLRDVMESFLNVDGQVILTGTKPPIEPVEGWTVIDLGTAANMPWCNGCASWIAAGVCPHGVGKPVDRSADIFAGM